MKKSELESMSVDSLRKKASELKIKNYIKLPKTSLIEKIWEFLLETGEGVEEEVTSSPEKFIELSQEELFLKKFSDLKNSVSLENGSEVAFTDYVGEKHIGTILNKDGLKYRIKSSLDNVVYTMAINRIEGAEELVKTSGTIDEFVVTDKMNKPLVVNQRLKIRINGSWNLGTLLEFKEIKEEDYVKVSVDGSALTKLISVADVIGLDEIMEVKHSESVKEIEVANDKGSINGFDIRKNFSKISKIDFGGINKGDKVIFKPFKKIEGFDGDLIGVAKNVFFDKQDGHIYFTVSHEEKDYCKRVGSISKAL